MPFLTTRRGSKLAVVEREESLFKPCEGLGSKKEKEENWISLNALLYFCHIALATYFANSTEQKHEGGTPIAFYSSCKCNVLCSYFIAGRADR